MKQLAEFWERRGTFGKLVTVVAAAVVAFAIISAITNGSDDSTNGTPATTATEADEVAEAGDPITCLENAGLSSVEQRDTDLWRGFHDSPYYGVFVHELPSEAEARQAVTDATDVFAFQAGIYAVTGPVKTAGGAAAVVVQDVAMCLGG